MRKRKDWIPVIMSIQTKNDYWKVINDADHTSFLGLLSCEIFTKDLCEVQRTDLFLEQFRMLAVQKKT